MNSSEQLRAIWMLAYDIKLESFNIISQRQRVTILRQLRELLIKRVLYEKDSNEQQRDTVLV